MKIKIPGCRFVPHRKALHIEVTVPKTEGKLRRRTTVPCENEDEIYPLWRMFRDEIFAELDLAKKTPLATPSEPTEDKPADILFAHHVTIHWKVLQKKLRNTNTRAHETWVVEDRLVAFFGQDCLHKINTIRVQDFIDHELDEGYSPATVNRFVSILRKILHDAEKRGLIKIYPLKGRLPRATEVPLQLELSADEEGRFLAAFDQFEVFQRTFKEDAGRRSHRRRNSADAPENSAGTGRGAPTIESIRYWFECFQASRAFFTAALQTALRLSDLRRLSWRAVDFDHNEIRLVMAKTKKELVLPMSATCRLILLECRKRPVVSPLVFVGPDGAPYSLSTIRRYFKLAKRLAGITRRLRIHDLRHTAACRLSSNGVSLQLIAGFLGHKSCRMAERYARPSAEARQLIAQALDRGNLNSSLNSTTLQHGAIPPSAVPIPSRRNRQKNKGIRGRIPKRKDGAGNGIRTRDFNLGKVALYH